MSNSRVVERLPDATPNRWRAIRGQMEGTIMQATISTGTHAAPAPMTRVWVARSMSALVVLFMAFDGVTKALRVPAVVQASAQLGFGAGAVFAIGIVALVCVALYAIPRTAPFGALLLTGYLGGAVATQVHTGAPAFSLIFPILLGVVAWGGLALRDRRLGALLAA